MEPMVITDKKKIPLRVFFFMVFLVFLLKYLVSYVIIMMLKELDQKEVTNVKSLDNAITVQKASQKDIEKYIVKAFEQTFAVEKQAVDFDQLRIKDDGFQQLRFNATESSLTARRTKIMDNFRFWIRRYLALDKNETVCYGDEYNRYGIGNNVRLPIIVKSGNREIHFGYLNANHDIYCNIKMFSLTDNDDEPISANRYEIAANRF